MTRITLIITFVALFLREADAQTQQDQPPKLPEVITGFFKSVADNKMHQACDDFINSNPFQIDNKLLHMSVNGSIQNVLGTAGKFEEFTPLIVKNYGKSLQYVYGFASFEKGPVRFEFILFRFKDTWGFYSLNLSADHLDYELRSQAGVSFFPPSDASQTSLQHQK